MHDDTFEHLKSHFNLELPASPPAVDVYPEVGDIGMLTLLRTMPILVRVVNEKTRYVSLPVDYTDYQEWTISSARRWAL
jgi:hypothetical protein